jgi:hypothetical protein
MERGIHMQKAAGQAQRVATGTLGPTAAGLQQLIDKAESRASSSSP